MINEIVEYINKGINTYIEKNKEIEDRTTKSNRSTIFNYNLGAINALNNLLKFISLLDIDINNESTINDIQVSIGGVILHKFEFSESLYIKLTTNEILIRLINDDNNIVIGKASCNVVGNLIYFRGVIDKNYIGVYNNIALSTDSDNSPFLLLKYGDSNFSIT